MTELTLNCSSDETIPPRGPGAPLGNTNALRHGRYSQRFNPHRLQSLLAQTPEPGDSDTPNNIDRDAAAPADPGRSLHRHLAILQATIEDLAQAASQGQGAAVPLLLHAIRSHATLATLSHSLDYPMASRLRKNPEGHTKCAECGTWWRNRLLSPQGLCVSCEDS